MKGDSRAPRHLSVLFPSLSTDILWKPAPASRVRFAAHKPRALDAATAFLQDPPVKKAKGRSSKVSTPAAPTRLRPTSIPDPSTLAYSSQKLVLTMGATVVLKRIREVAQDRYGVTLSNQRILSAFRKNDIPADLMALLTALDDFRRQTTSGTAA